MLKKRLVGVITVKEGRAVQSIGYRRHLPLGTAECMAQNLDRWGVDEILVTCIDRSRWRLGPDFPLLTRLGALGLSTPLTYAGGVHTAEEAAAVIQCGAERLCVDAALHGDRHRIRAMAERLGSQALIAAMPLSAEGGQIRWYNYLTGSAAALVAADVALLAEGVISECLVIDWRNEGKPGSFDMSLVRGFPLKDMPMIAFGGVSRPDQVAALLAMQSVVAVAVGNFLSYAEHAAQALRGNAAELPLRPAVYAAEY